MNIERWKKKDFEEFVTHWGWSKHGERWTKPLALQDAAITECYLNDECLSGDLLMSTLKVMFKGEPILEQK